MKGYGIGQNEGGVWQRKVGQFGGGVLVMRGERVKNAMDIIWQVAFRHDYRDPHSQYQIERYRKININLVQRLQVNIPLKLGGIENT